MQRRAFNLHLTLGLLAATCGVRAEGWPDKPVKFIVPFAPGSSPDQVNRMFGKELGDALGQPIVIDNRPGANGITGTILGLTSPPDGYTLISVNVGTLAINPSLFPKQKYDPLVDLIPVGLITGTMNALVVRADLPAKNVAELVALMKARPGALSMGSSGTGTTGHLSGELFKEMTGTDAVHVPFRGSAPAYTEMMAGRCDFMFDNLISAGTFVRDGRVRMLAVSGAQRSPLFPDVPTLAEAGLRGYETQSWTGLGVPKGTPPAIVAKLKQAVQQANHSAAMAAWYKQSGATAMPPMSDEQMVRFVRAEQAKWGALVKRSGASNT
ncbi:MAG: tripartite tricarboxylate transporter substrate binding protein [Ramlibacter sp.]|nr:tripartite tricarboxylate transporter substrate binding protein [Ramlibacter sp.]MDB5913838.1 tripartite tricarboxylate transporter substrate binding protein [Ramlibacter sp.]